MKYFILFLFLPIFCFAQKSEVVKDSISFGTAINECGDTVFMLTQIIEFRGGRKVTSSQPVGFDENNACSGIKRRDTAQLVNFYANPLIDYGRQSARNAINFILQSRDLKSFNAVDNALKKFGATSIFRQVEKNFADSLIGSYILVRPGVANTNPTITKTAQGQVRIRINAQNVFSLTIYSDTWIRAKDLGGAGSDVDLYQIEKGRWISLLANYQLVKNTRQIFNQLKP